MNPQKFHVQWQRLVVRFGARSMDDEFKLLASKEVHDMGEAAFHRFVDVMIGSRTANKPPLLSEFREARLAENKLRFDNMTRAAAQTLFGPDGPPADRRAHVLKVLSKEYGAVNSITEALEIARLRLRTDGDPA